MRWCPFDLTSGRLPTVLEGQTRAVHSKWLGLWLRENPGRLETLPLEARDGLLGRYLLPRPRLDLIPMLASAATASMDISDGLVGDLAKLMGVSGVSAEVTLSDIPLSLAALQAIALSPELLEIALTGGDDYEILFTIPLERLEDMIKDARAAGCPITVIGAVEKGDQPLTVTHRGERFLTRAGSFSHF